MTNDAELNLPNLDEAQKKILDEVTKILSNLVPNYRERERKDVIGEAYRNQLRFDTLYALRHGANDTAQEVLDLVRKAKSLLDEGVSQEKIMFEAEEIIKKLPARQTTEAENTAKAPQTQTPATQLR